MGAKTQLSELKVQFENAKIEMAKPFPQEAELQSQLKELAEITARLDIDGKPNSKSKDKLTEPIKKGGLTLEDILGNLKAKDKSIEKDVMKKEKDNDLEL